MDLLGFLYALFADWVALMSGVVSVALLVWGAIRKWSNPPTPIIFGVAAVCFVIAAARIWTTENRKVLELTKTLELKDRPSLHGKIQQIGYAHIPASKTILVSVVLSIRNTGMDSFVDGWKLQVILSDDRTIESTRHYFVVGEEQVFPMGDGEVAYGPDDAIYNKLPIKTGDQITGFINFEFSGIRSELLAKKGTHYRLFFNDVVGKQYSTPAWFLKGLSTEPLYFPGTSPTIRPKKPK